MLLITAKARLASAQARLKRAKSKLESRKAGVKKQAAYVAKVTKRVKARQATVDRLSKKASGPWMPGVIRDPVASIGPCTVGSPAGLLHTTEGESPVGSNRVSFTGMDRVLKAKKACPTFLVGQAGETKQYRPWGDAGTALENPPGGVETNRKRLVQIEVCAMAGRPGQWPAAQKQAVAKIMAWAHGHGVPLECTVTFTDSQHVKRMTGANWIMYSGWCGHQHAPEQPSGHWDPGKIDINELLALARALV